MGFLFSRFRKEMNQKCWNSGTVLKPRVLSVRAEFVNRSSSKSCVTCLLLFSFSLPLLFLHCVWDCLGRESPTRTSLIVDLFTTAVDNCFCLFSACLNVWLWPLGECCYCFAVEAVVVTHRTIAQPSVQRRLISLSMSVQNSFFAFFFDWVRSLIGDKMEGGTDSGLWVRSIFTLCQSSLWLWPMFWLAVCMETDLG